LVVRENKTKAVEEDMHGHDSKPDGTAITSLRSLVGNRAVLCAYIGSGLQLYVAGAIPAWLPTYFARYYGLGIGRAASLAALFLLMGGVGMVLCGMLSDRLAKARPERKISLAILYCLTCALLLCLAFSLRPGLTQLVLLCGATFVAAGTTGPAGAMVANLTPRALHGTAFATLTLANNLLGLAPGPVLTGRLADSIGLVGALRLLPIACALSMCAFLFARTTYLADLSGVAMPGPREARA
jgi:sugar phosphate permease